METQNMKLLDLQTGKYLELDKDFWFGGNVIILFENLKRSAKVNACARFIKQPHADPLINSICEKTGAVVYGGRYVLMQSILYEGQDEFNTIQGFVGDIAITSIGEFLMLCYGKKSQYCNIQKFHTKTKFSQVYFYDSNDGVEMLLRCKIGHNLLVNGMVKNEYKGNIFEEYSKQLRNEPNKFDELKELLK